MKPHEKVEYEMAFDLMKKALPALLGTYNAIATASKAYYDELIIAGFSESQALHIIATQGITARMRGDNE